MTSLWVDGLFVWINKNGGQEVILMGGRKWGVCLLIKQWVDCGAKRERDKVDKVDKQQQMMKCGHCDVQIGSHHCNIK